MASTDEASKHFQMLTDKLRDAINVQSIGQLQDYLVFGVVSFLTIIFICVLTCQKKKKKFENAEKNGKEQQPQKVRFRKRDRLRFYTTKMLRKVRQFKDDVLPGTEEVSVKSNRKRYRRRSSAFSRLLQREESESIRVTREPPAALLEADFTEMTGSETHLPAEVMYMLKSVRVFGHFEKPLFFELCKYIITKSFPMGKTVFKPGLMEECIYIVQSGQINLYLVDKKGTEMLLKKVKAGDNIHSVMNILDAIRGSSSYRYSILIRAAVDSEVLMLPSRAFKKVFEDHPESLVRIVQIVMLRLQQVTFQALYRFLGLSTELISTSSTRRINEELKSLSVYSLGNNTKEAKDVPRPVDLVSPGRGCTSIKEDQEDMSSSQGIPTNQNKPSLKRSMTLDKSQSKTSPVQIRRTGSHGRLVNLYGSSTLSEQNTIMAGVSSTDFDAVLGRVGLDTSEPISSFGIATSDEELSGVNFEFPKEGSFQLVCDDAVPVFSEIAAEEEEKMLAAVRSDVVKLLNLPTPKLLDNILSLDKIPSGAYLVKQGDKDSSLFFLVQGKLEVTQTRRHTEEQDVLFTCVPGEFMGSLSLITGDSSFFSIRTTVTSYVVTISKINFYKLIKEHPKIVLPIANSLIQKISSFVRNIDFALDWMMLESGKPLYRQKEEPDSIFIMLNGRLRAVRTHESGKKVIGTEYGRGEFVGLVEVLTHTERHSSVHAIRDTELAQIPEGLLNTIKVHYPQVVTRLIQLLGDRIIGSMKKGPLSVNDAKLEMVGKNLCTVAMIPASNSVPLNNFTFELGLAINNIGPTLVLTSDVVKKRLGKAVLDSVHEYNLSNWLAYQEDQHRIVVYQADMSMTEWTKRCIRQADIILIVCLADEEPKVGKLEAQLESMTSVRAQKDLILLYDEDTFDKPSGTIDWLNARQWISTHHHVRCPRKIFRRRLLSSRYANDPNYEGPSKQSDFSRLARVLTGTSIGLVLGGGGARGISHVGIIKALSEAGVPIDSVCGTSMGAFVGAIYALDGNVVRTTQRCREACMKMASLWKKLLDITYPYTSLFTGKAFNYEIESTFGETQIEDMLLPYFCVTTDISNSTMKIHQTGCAWRYIRASMSLSGYLPPMCDPADGHLLLDGGYVNNLPADIMRTLGVKTIIAVDVGSHDEVELTNFGDALSGWWMLWKKYNPFAAPVRIPDMAGIQSRLAYVSCVKQLQEVKTGGYAHYIRPPIDRFKTLQFGSFDEILEVGYHHGKAVFNSLLQGNVLPNDMSPQSDKSSQKRITVGGNSAPSFTDLAELVSRIKQPVTISQHGANKKGRPLFENWSDEDDDDVRADQEDGRNIYSRGAMSDQDMIPESDYLSNEEQGYESEDITQLRKRHFYQRTNSSNV